MGNKQAPMNAQKNAQTKPKNLITATFKPNPLNSWDPNTGSEVPKKIEQSSPSVRGCFDDEYCKNIDNTNSTPDNVIYSCPDAVCRNNTCQCGPNCQLDPYTGMCCQELVQVRGQTFCKDVKSDKDWSGLQNPYKETAYDKNNWDPTSIYYQKKQKNK